MITLSPLGPFPPPLSGKPPFPLVKDMAEDEIEYVTRWLDFYQAGKSEDGVKDLG